MEPPEELTRKEFTHLSKLNKVDKVANKYFTKSEVVFMTSDGVIFYDSKFARAHADKNGLQLKEFKKPKKRVKNGTK